MKIELNEGARMAIVAVVWATAITVVFCAMANCSARCDEASAKIEEAKAHRTSKS